MFDRDAAIEALGGYSLVRADPESLTVHRLVQAVTRDDLDEATTRIAAERAVRLVDKALPDKAHEHRNWPTIGTLLPHALAASGEAERLGVGLDRVVEILTKLAHYHQGRGAWIEAEPLLLRVTHIDEQQLDPDDLELAIGLNNLASCQRVLGRHAEAQERVLRAIGIGQKRLRSGDPDRKLEAVLATWRNNLAGIYQETGRYGEAECLFQEAINSGVAVLGPNDPTVAIRSNNLGTLYYETRRWAAAEECYLRAIEFGERRLAPDHLYLASWRHNLANLYQRTDRLKEARPLYRCALASYKRVLGLGHPDVAKVLEHYAVLLERLGRGGKASKLRAIAEAARQSRPRP